MFKRVAVLVPPLHACSRTSAKSKDTLWRKKLIQAILEYDADIIPFICTESCFGGYTNGLQRVPHGISYYSSLDGYREFCRRQAEVLYEQVVSMEEGGYTFAAVIGIEHSPSCAVKYMYSNRGTIQRPGIFMECLMDFFSQKEPNITFIGVNRRYPQKAIENLSHTLRQFC